jgi:hypothetical protein
LEEYLSRDAIYEQQESPFGKAINQTVDMFKATKVDIKLIEPEVTLPRHEPSVKATIVVSVGSPIRSVTTSLLSSVCSAVLFFEPPIAEPVKQQLEEYISRDDIYEQESPFGKAINQSVDMFKATKVDIKLIEPEVTYKAGVDVMMMLLGLQ